VKRAQHNVVVFKGRRRGDRDEALEQILQEHCSALRQFLRMHLALEPDREDVIQDVFVRLACIEDLAGKFAGRPDSVRSYLFAMARNLIRDRNRRARVRQTAGHVPYDDEIGIVAQATPEDTLCARQKVQAMRRALRQAKPKHRRAFVLSRFKHMSYREIADDLGVSVSTVEKYISTVLAALREDTAS